jgi:hypothetical protein
MESCLEGSRPGPQAPWQRVRPHSRPLRRAARALMASTRGRGATLKGMAREVEQVAATRPSAALVMRRGETPCISLAARALRAFLLDHERPLDASQAGSLPHDIRGFRGRQEAPAWLGCCGQDLPASSARGQCPVPDRSSACWRRVHIASVGTDCSPPGRRRKRQGACSAPCVMVQAPLAQQREHTAVTKVHAQARPKVCPVPSPQERALRAGRWSA